MRQSSLIKLFDLKRFGKAEDAEEIAQLEAEVNVFCDSLFDPLTAICFRERFINGLSWDRIADIAGFGSADAVRKRVNRFMKGLPL